MEKNIDSAPMHIKNMKSLKLLISTAASFFIFSSENKRARTQERQEEGPDQIKVAAYKLAYSDKGTAREM